VLGKQRKAEMRGVPRDRRLNVIDHVSDIQCFYRHDAPRNFIGAVGQYNNAGGVSALESAKRMMPECS
jgi:hypothetical protein